MTPDENPLGLGSKKPSTRKLVVIGFVVLFIFSLLFILIFSFGIPGAR